MILTEHALDTESTFVVRSVLETDDGYRERVESRIFNLHKKKEPPIVRLKEQHNKSNLLSP